MTLMIDNFSEQLAGLRAAGWVITEFSRYDPTHITGLTPSGKVFTLDAAGSQVSITVAGNTRNVNIAKVQWEQGDLLVEKWLAAHQALPAGQR